MIYLILSILSSTAIFVIFKFLHRHHIPSFPVIVYNYLFASLTGFILVSNQKTLLFFYQSNWLYLSVIIGILFIVMFGVISKSSRKAGISVTTVASKMSVVTPIAFSIIYDPLDHFSFIKFFGIVIAFIAVFLTIYRKKTLDLDMGVIYLPLLLFIGMGLVDSLVKYAQFRYVNNNEVASFATILFFISFLTGLISINFKRPGITSMFNMKSLIWGIMLGISNFGSIYFLIRTLNHRSPHGNVIDSSIVFGVNNTGIVVLSVFTGFILFREKLKQINWIGIGLALVAIIIFAYTI